MQDSSSVLVDLEFVKALLVNMDSAVEQEDPSKLIGKLEEARTKIDEIIQNLQYQGGI